MDDDIQDLLYVLAERFGPVPDDVAAAVRGLTDVQQVNRLILVAANSADLPSFLHELRQGPNAFRL